MANKLILPSEKFALVATIDPDAYGAITAYTLASDFVDCQDFQQLMVVVMAGTVAASGKIDAKLQQATDSTGGGVKDITGFAITQLTTADNDKQAIINVDAMTDLDIANGFRWLRAVVKNTTAGADMGVAIFGLEPTYGPANDHDLASVDEIV